MHEYFATYAAACSEHNAITPPGAGEDAGVHLLTEPQLDDRAVAGVTSQ
jgi:hypothetical protein